MGNMFSPVVLCDVPYVINEMLLPAEALAAVGTGVRHVAGVLTDVVVQVGLARERSRTIRALVRRFTRVLSAQQQTTFRFEHHATPVTANRPDPHTGQTHP